MNARIPPACVATEGRTCSHPPAGPAPSLLGARVVFDHPHCGLQYGIVKKLRVVDGIEVAVIVGAAPKCEVPARYLHEDAA